eukprot:5059500-Amphidinium_carterae.2
MHKNTAQCPCDGGSLRQRNHLMNEHTPPRFVIHCSTSPSKDDGVCIDNFSPLTSTTSSIETWGLDPTHCRRGMEATSHIKSETVKGTKQD